MVPIPNKVGTRISFCIICKIIFRFHFTCSRIIWTVDVKYFFWFWFFNISCRDYFILFYILVECCELFSLAYYVRVDVIDKHINVEYGMLIVHGMGSVACSLSLVCVHIYMYLSLSGWHDVFIRKCRVIFFNSWKTFF